MKYEYLPKDLKMKISNLNKKGSRLDRGWGS